MIPLNYVSKRCLLKFPILSRTYKVLAIESSCDDSCVCLIDRFDPNQPPKVIENLKKTLDSSEAGGIIPTSALYHHQENISTLVQQILSSNGLSNKNPPDLICVTRGPGMVGSLSIGLQFAKGLSVAWNKPMIGVHHMLGHLLIPRFSSNFQEPSYPFLSLLVSGGHTMVVLSKSLTEHDVLINTDDIACGDSLDKCARAIGINGNMLGKELEKFVEAGGIEPMDDFVLCKPLENSPKRVNYLGYSFAPFISSVTSYMETNFDSNFDNMTESQRRSMGSKIQEAHFDHLIAKINLLLQSNPQVLEGVKHFICSGGVGANFRLREKLSNLNTQTPLKYYFPDPSLCTDNAIMIGSAGIEIYENLKLKTKVGTKPIRKWPINDLLNVPDWEKMEDNYIEKSL